MEKLFKTTAKVLGMLNLDNADQAYSDQAHLVMKRIEERREWELGILKPIFIRLKEAQADKLQWEKKHGRKSGNFGCSTNRIAFMDLPAKDYEYEITKEIIERYKHITYFYHEKNDWKMKAASLKDLARVVQCLDEMRFYKSISLEAWEEDEVISEIVRKLRIDMSGEHLIQYQRWIDAIVLEKL